MEGERENGDTVVARVEGGRALVAVIDGLGHGPKAASVATEAAHQLEREGLDRPLGEIMRGLHERLRGTRGVAATVCVLTDYALSVCGVGNVSLRSTGTPIPFMLSPGILGSRVHRFREVTTRLRPGDRVVLFSDGLSSGFSLDTVSHLDAEAACESLFAGHRKRTDDATVLVMDVAKVNVATRALAP